MQIGLVEERPARVGKPLAGHFKKAGVPPTRVRREVNVVKGDDAPAAGETVLVTGVFTNGDRVDVIGISRGKGFQGVMRRHNFAGGAATHGSMFHRAPGSIGASSYPSRVVKGMRAAGRMGGDRVTVRNLKIVQVDAENNLLVVHGAVPGAPGGYVVVRKAIARKPEPQRQVEKPSKAAAVKQAGAPRRSHRSSGTADMQLTIVNGKNEKVGDLELKDELFGGRVKTDLIWEAVVQENAGERRGTHATKTRAEVSGSGKKPWRQKGTGRARVGEIRNPLWRKGGTVFGPQPRSYAFELPKKVRRGALRRGARRRSWPPARCRRRQPDDDGPQDQGHGGAAGAPRGHRQDAAHRREARRGLCAERAEPARRGAGRRARA